MARNTWHWVCIEDDDLGFILDGPDMNSGEDAAHDWITDVIGIIEDGLETA